MKTTLAVHVIASLLIISVGGRAQSTVPWSVVDMGFAVSSSPTTIVTSAVGQSFAGMMPGATSIIQSGFLADTLFRSTVTSAGESAGLPKEYALRQNYPNPFNPSTTIRFELPRSSHVSLKLYNALGQEVATLVEGERAAGVYDVAVHSGRLASGMYVFRLTAGDFVSARRCLLLK